MYERIKQINDRLKNYCEHLSEKNPLFLNNIDYFARINDIFKDAYEKYALPCYQDKLTSLQSALTKVSMTDSLNLVKKYFHDTYNGTYDNEIKDIEKNGVINLYYKDEDNEREDKYDQDYHDDIFFCGFNEHPYVNLPCYGTMIDGAIIAHEIRHYLNMPDKNHRNYTNDTITEGLSIFEEFNYLDYIEKIYSIEEVNFFRKYLIYLTYTSCDNFNSVSLLVAMYDKLGKVSIENYKLLVDEKEINGFETNVLSKRLKLNIEFTHWYVFGTMIASYMHQLVKENGTFITKIIDFNIILKSNPTSGEFINVFRSIGLNINDLELLEKYLIKEVEWIKTLTYNTQITK